MPTTAKLAQLFRALSAHDWPRAHGVAESIANAEEEAGHHSAAARLRSAMATTGPQPEAKRELLLSTAHPDVLCPLPTRRLKDVELRPRTRTELEEILQEAKHKARLARHGLRPRQRLLFHGPPGCGKTITACALAGELGWPAFVVRFDALLGSYLGQTALRLREIFRFVEAERCVVVIDEIDAIGLRRGNPSDVGEIDRIVISLMQQLDLAEYAGLIVAASNVAEKLDPALVRRFDAIVGFPAPSQTQLRAFAEGLAKRKRIDLVNGARHGLAKAKTFADAERVVESEHRRIILRNGEP